jgi:hypothetical protein
LSDRSDQPQPALVARARPREHDVPVNDASLSIPLGPPRQPVWAAALLITFLALGVGLLGWLIFSGNNGIKGAASDNNAPIANGSRSSRISVGGIKLLNRDNWLVTAGDAYMQINDSGSQLHCSFDRHTILTGEQQGLLIGRGAADNAVFAQSLGLSPRQIEQLRAIRVPDLRTTDADEERLRAAWKEYQRIAQAQQDPISSAVAAAKKTAEQTVVQTLDEIGAKSFEVTRQGYVDASERVRSVLTEEQVKQVITLDRVPTGAMPSTHP